MSRPTQPPPVEAPDGSPAFTVGALTRRLQTVVEDEFGTVWVVGEVSQFTAHQSGHCYLTLKDAQGATIGGVIWRATAGRMKWLPEPGAEVLARGRVTIYAPQSKYQLQIDRLEPRGQGALHAAFERLKQRLAAEGLFDAARKRPLPVLPRAVGVITSPTGAALRDFLSIARRRHPGVRLIVIGARVQGEGAAADVARAIAEADDPALGLDVLVVTRGGGSLEDLWAFNEEPVARAIAAARLPVVSAVGHEVDVTIADFVADLRAPTPSAAAELIIPRRAEWRTTLAAHRERLRMLAARRVQAARALLDARAQSAALRHPLARLGESAQRLDLLHGRLTRAMTNQRRRARRHLEAEARLLAHLSPLATLGRGYAALTRPESRRAVTGVAQLAAGEAVWAWLADGRAHLRVESVSPDRLVAPVAPPPAPPPNPEPPDVRETP